jgi:3-hydroxyisobutyrate dehydrogenase-like beta-hydroxyacid dehydrogenase
LKEDLLHIGFIGLGQMGQPIARHLLQAGSTLRIYDREASRLSPLEELGAIPATSPAGTVQSGDVVFSMVPDDVALWQIVEGEQGLLTAVGAGGVHISLSTVSPVSANELARRYREQGSAFLSAPVLGRPDLAEAGKLSVFLAGDGEAKTRVAPLLRLFSERIFDCADEAGSANVAKLAANSLVAAAILAMAEAAAFIKRHGMEPAAFLHMVSETPLFSGGVYRSYGQMIGADCYAPARFPVPLGLKDVRLLLDAAASVGATMSIAHLVQKHLEQALSHGWSAQDWAVIGRVVANLPPVSPDPRRSSFGAGQAQQNGTTRSRA